MRTQADINGGTTWPTLVPRSDWIGFGIPLRGVELVVDRERVVVVQRERARHGKVAAVDLERPWLERLETRQVGDEIGGRGSLPVAVLSALCV